MAKKFDPKAKAKKQKIIAAVLGVLLLGVLAYEVPSLMKSMNKKPPSAAVAQPPPPGTPIAGAPVVPVAGAPVAVPAATTLVDSDPPAQAASGQLLSFDRFSSKDPFVQQVDAAGCNADPTSAEAPTCTAAAAGAPAPAAETRTATRPNKPLTVTPAPSRPPPPPASNPSAARISVNGAPEWVDLSKTFPKSDPVFRLVALTRTTAKIGVAGGSLS